MRLCPGLFDAEALPCPPPIGGESQSMRPTRRHCTGIQPRPQRCSPWRERFAIAAMHRGRLFANDPIRGHPWREGSRNTPSRYAPVDAARGPGEAAQAAAKIPHSTYRQDRVTTLRSTPPGWDEVRAASSSPKTAHARPQAHTGPRRLAPPTGRHSRPRPQVTHAPDRRSLVADDARFLAVAAEDDHFEGGAREHLDRAEGFAETVVMVAPERGGAGGAYGCWMDGCCAHVSMVDRRA